MKRGIVFALVLFLVIALTAGTALAVPPWIDGDGPGVGKSQVKVKNQFKHTLDFPDVPNKHWAREHVRVMLLRGIINGYPDGKFHPSNTVKSIEALAMILRAEYDVDDESIVDFIYDKDDGFRGIPGWGIGYLQYALDEEIILETELKYFNPMRPAKRYQVAIWLGRALDLDEADEDEIKELGFRDLREIPGEALEYLPELVDEGYFSGYPNGKFMPNKPVTRAEMAKILDLDAVDEEDSDTETDEETGIFMNFTWEDDDDDTVPTEITIKIGDDDETFDLDEDVDIEIDNADADAEDLFYGMLVTLEFEDGKVLSIEAATEISGTVVDVDEDNGDEELTLLVNDTEYEFDLDGIDIDGDDLADLVYGMEVTIRWVDAGELDIDAEEEIEAVLEEDYDDGDDEISVELDGDLDPATYDVDDDVDIDGFDIEEESIPDGTEVVLTFEEGKVVIIEVLD